MVTTRERAVLWSSLGAAVLMLCWMGRSLVTGEIPFTGDLLHWNYPIRDFYARALADGQRVWWWPAVFGGFDLGGEGQVGAFHPLHLILYLVVPVDRAFIIELVTPYGFLFLGAWLFLRRWCQGSFAAFGAMLIAFSGFTLSHGVHMNMVAVVAHIPWLLWTCDRLFAAGTLPARLSLGVGIAALTSSQILLGHPQAVWWSALLAAAYLAFLVTVRPVGDRLLAVATAVAGALLGAGIGGVQLLSTFVEAQRSTRPLDDATWATSFSLPPVQLLQLLEPYAFWGRVVRWTEAPGAGDEFAVYAGVVPLTLSAWWLASGLSAKDGPDSAVNRLAWWGLGVSVVGLWLATGSYGKLYYLETWIPIVRAFRAPVRYVLFAHFGFALVAVAALIQLATIRPRPLARASTLAPWGLVAASVLGALWLRGSGTSSRPMDVALIIGPALFTLAALLVTCAARGYHGAVTALVLLAAADHALYGLGGVVAWQDFLTRPAAERFIDPRDAGIPVNDGRLARGGFPNLHTLGGYRLIDGYAGLTPRKALDYKTPNTLRVAGVRYANTDFLGSVRIPGAARLPRDWFKLPAPVPRARLVADVRVTRDPRADIEGIDVAQTALVAQPISALDGLVRDPSGTAAIDRDNPGDIVVSTSAPAFRLLVVNESFHDGWTVAVDGGPARVEQVYGDFMGVVVPAGTHRIEFTFTPPLFALGAGVSLASLAAAIALLTFANWGRRSFKEDSR